MTTEFMEQLTEVAVELIKDGKATPEDCIEKAIMHNIDFCAEMIEGDTQRAKDYKKNLCEEIYSKLNN